MNRFRSPKRGVGSRSVSHWRSRLTYANVMSTLAVFLFLAGGTAYATHLVVNGSDVVDGSLTGADIAFGTLNDQDIEGESIHSGLVRNNSLTGWDIRDETVGADDVSRDIVSRWGYSSTNFPVPAFGTASASADCGARRRVLGGGFSQTAFDVQITDSQPNAHHNAWVVYARNQAAVERRVTVYALCAAAS